MKAIVHTELAGKSWPRRVDKVLHVGVDAHKATSHTTVMDEPGKVLKRKQVQTSPTGLRQALGCYQEPETDHGVRTRLGRCVRKKLWTSAFMAHNHMGFGGDRGSLRIARSED